MAFSLASLQIYFMSIANCSFSELQTTSENTYSESQSVNCLTLKNMCQWADKFLVSLLLVATSNTEHQLVTHRKRFHMNAGYLCFKSFFDLEIWHNFECTKPHSVNKCIDTMLAKAYSASPLCDDAAALLLNLKQLQPPAKELAS